MSFQFTYQATTIQYQMEGNGATVLLLHGFGEDSSIFKLLFDQLKTNYRVVLPDLPGSGASNFSITICSSIDAMADAMQALMDEISNEPFVVLGHSMGGYIALAMAESRPKRLKAFGLLHSTAFADSEEKKETRQKAIGFIKENGAYAFLKTAIPGLFSTAFTQKQPAVVETLVEKGRAFSSAALVAYYEAMKCRPDRTSVLGKTGVPVLFIIGEFDKAAPMNDVLQQVPLPAISQVSILRHTAHMGMFEEPERFNEAVVQFLNEVA